MKPLFKRYIWICLFLSALLSQACSHSSKVHSTGGSADWSAFDNRPWDKMSSYSTADASTGLLGERGSSMTGSSTEEWVPNSPSHAPDTRTPENDEWQ
jgi:hypothetical protein